MPPWQNGAKVRHKEQNMKKQKTQINNSRIALGNWLREQRQAKGLTMRNVAELMEVPHSLIGKIECNQRRLDVGELIAYSDILGVKAADALTAAAVAR